MVRGFVKLWRKELDSGLLKNHKAWGFWSYCLMKATWKDYKAVVGYQTVHLTPGQFVFGHNKASEETGLTISEIRTAIKLLRSMGNLTVESTHKYSIITIVNWNMYQNVMTESDMQYDELLTREEQHTRKLEYKEKAEYKKETRKNASEKKIFLDYSAEEESSQEGNSLEQFLRNRTKERNAEASVPDFMDDRIPDEIDRILS